MVPWEYDAARWAALPRGWLQPDAAAQLRHERDPLGQNAPCRAAEPCPRLTPVI